MGESFGGVDLPRPDLGEVVVERDHRLGPGAAGAGADRQQRHHGVAVLAPAAAQFDFETGAAVEHFLGDFDQQIQLQLL